MAENNYQSNSGEMRRHRHRKVCHFCKDKVSHIDYKDINRLRRFVNERGKIVSRRTTGTCMGHQKLLTTAIKRARNIALLPFVTQ
ncbi:MAG: 30S ribosomal protein S18 [Candidatus Riflebacteria bacterium]|nr:30S ribosomal protein S18 [Candidatus Riflebacteria bacterium]